MKSTSRTTKTRRLMCPHPPPTPSLNPRRRRPPTTASVQAGSPPGASRQRSRTTPLPRAVAAAPSRAAGPPRIRPVDARRRPGQARGPLLHPPTPPPGPPSRLAVTRSSLLRRHPSPAVPSCGPRSTSRSERRRSCTTGPLPVPKLRRGPVRARSCPSSTSNGGGCSRATASRRPGCSRSCAGWRITL